MSVETLLQALKTIRDETDCHTGRLTWEGVHKVAAEAINAQAQEGPAQPSPCSFTERVGDISVTTTFATYTELLRFLLTSETLPDAQKDGIREILKEETRHFPPMYHSREPLKKEGQTPTNSFRGVGLTYQAEWGAYITTQVSAPKKPITGREFVASALHMEESEVIKRSLQIFIHNQWDSIPWEFSYQFAEGTRLRILPIPKTNPTTQKPGEQEEVTFKPVEFDAYDLPLHVKFTYSEDIELPIPGKGLAEIKERTKERTKDRKDDPFYTPGTPKE